METRTKALAAVDAGKTQGEVAAVLGVSTRWISGLLTKRRRGQRLVAAAPAGCWGQTTMIAALARDGMRAAFAFPGAVDGAAFRTFVARVLAPTLRPGDVVVWDNLAVHADAQALAAVRAAGAEVRPLPAYSPDLNPIEQACQN